MAGIADLLDLLVEALQFVTVLFLAYGAYLAIRRTDGLQITDGPASHPLAEGPRVRRPRPGKSNDPGRKS